MKQAERVALWEAINDYTRACGGDTSRRTISDDRMCEVVRVERAVDEIARSNVPSEVGSWTVVDVAKAWLARRGVCDSMLAQALEDHATLAQAVATKRSEEWTRRLAKRYERSLDNAQAAWRGNQEKRRG